MTRTKRSTVLPQESDSPLDQMQRLADLIIEPKTIKCQIIFNASCIKCDAINNEMIRVGAFVMCRRCWKAIFGVEKIDVDSELYKTTYKKWLEKYNKKWQ